MEERCDYSRLNQLKVRELPEDVKINFLKRNDLLGYTPTPGFNQIIDFSHWSKVKVSIDKNGYRDNDNNITNDNNSILAIGDSFTFGDQVSNDKTWPSCLERSLNQRVTNAGVSGYGAAQAVKRAGIILEENHYDLIILSILLSEDFYRDQLDYFSGLPRPAVTINQGTVDWSSLSSTNSIGSKWHPAQISPYLTLLSYAWRYSIIGATIIDRVSAMKNSSINWTGRRLTRKNPKAAPVNAIINFTFKKLSLLPAPKKYVLFQYSRGDLSNPELSELRRIATKSARHYDIHVLDSFEYLTETQNSLSIRIWDGHHTVYGNELMCQFIATSLHKNE